MKKIPKDIPRWKGIPIFRCIVHTWVNEVMEHAWDKHNMELQEAIRQALVAAYELGKRASRAAHKK